MRPVGLEPSRSRWVAIPALIALAVGLLLPATSTTVAAAAEPAASSARAAGVAQEAVAAGIVKAADLSQFDPTNIISDRLFFDGNAMTSAEIQTFLDQRIGTCSNGKCLNVSTASISSRDARVSSSTGNLICSAIQGGTMRVSELIYRVQIACGISAKVILVTLQKEQGLTTSRAPSDWNLNAAMGQACPDTAPCDPAFKGLGPQIVGGVTQLKTYSAARFGKQPGSNYIQYNPNAGCGGTTINIQNWATASLYTYTPYQPNAAALRAGYGLGDGCSSYGNRNFYQYYVDWFGSTRGGYASLLRDPANGDMYLVSGTTKYRFSTAERAGQFQWIAGSRNAASGELATFTDGGIAPRAVRTDNGELYLLDSGRRLRIASCGVASEYGWDCASLPLVLQAQVENYPNGGFLERAAVTLGGTWLIQGSTRRQMTDLGILPRYGIPAVATAVSDTMGAEYAVGDPVLDPGIYTDPSGKMVAVTRGGNYSVPASSRVAGFTAAAKPLAAESLSRIGVGADLPARTTVDGAQYLLVAEGWLQVDAYGSLVTFSPLASGSADGIPRAGAATGPHFVREQSDPTVYLISAGTRQAVSAAEQNWIVAAYGVNSRVWVTLDGSLGLPPVAITDAIVKNAAGAVFLIDGGRRYQFLDCAQVADWGAQCSTAPVKTAAQLQAIPLQGALERLVRKPDGSTWLIQSGGRREVPDARVLAPYGIGSASSAVTGATIDALSIGTPVIGSGAFSDGNGQYALATPGGAYRLTDATRLSVVTAGMRTLTKGSFALLGAQRDLPVRMLSDRRAFILTELGWLEVDPAQYGGMQLFTEVGSAGWLGVRLYSYESRPHFIRERNSGQEYLISGGYAQSVADAATHAWIVARYGVPSYTWTLAAGGASGLRLPVGSLVKDPSGAVALVDEGAFYRLTSCSVAVDLGRDCAAATTMSFAQTGLNDRGTLQSLIVSGSGNKWLLQGGVRREVPDPAVLAPYGIGANATAVSNTLLQSFAVGAPVVGAGVFTDSADMRIITGTGRVVDVPSAARVDAIRARAVALSSASLAKLPASATLPSRASSNGATLVLATNGWLRVNATDYGSLAFSATPADVVAAVTTSGAATGPHFVREASASQVYLASGGLSPMDEQQRAWVTATYGVSPTVQIVADGALR
ncbi:hypothetical protein [Microbacterium sp. SORGH_AS_0862]|uniref:hypothetical protein n=1 Tax=Microbacterium sp. SORGH_AS_0862 TaxID=3041789 RepID=UPI00278CD830|nr:hypothetical protein [Microbacterium sp. SORGH_AS_0862]MDQ1204250.1 hypothetical protein [Microbacterium sp. SORGH_AS_0862]